MLTVWTIDGETRLILPDSQWGKEVVKALGDLGYVVEKSDQPSDSCERDDDEMARMHALLNETKL